MDRAEMLRRYWKPYMELEYKHERMNEVIVCLLISINFDDEIVELQPLGENYKQQSFFSTIKNISIPKRLRAVAINGKKVKEAMAFTEKKVFKDNFKNVNPVG